ncbi:MAG: hypothetical protein LBG44_10520 [Gemmatimonadota bacterium]|jgi:hypothetical protein|nr:hypothetical protein [Gemmatimonadota bacterium]
MRSVRQVAGTVLVAVGFLLGSPGSGHAQSGTGGRANVVSANPFGILLEWFNLEYERVISDTGTLGIGGSTFRSDQNNYYNLDLFGRFYLRDRALDGPMFGARVGLTSVPDQGTYPGIGFDLNWSWLMSRNDNFYVGIGFGIKRLMGVDREGEGSDFLIYIPTFRLVNVGIVF